MLLKLKFTNDTFYIWQSNNFFRHVYTFDIYKFINDYKNPNDSYWDSTEKQFARRMFG